MPPSTLAYRLQKAASHLTKKSLSALNVKAPPLEYDKYQKSFYITLPIPTSQEVAASGNAFFLLRLLLLQYVIHDSIVRVTVGGSKERLY